MMLAERIASANGLAALAEGALDLSPGEIMRPLSSALGASRTEDGQAGALSGLNHDGVPLQVCLSLRQDACAVRVIIDPAISELEPKQRYIQAKAAAQSSFRRAGQEDQEQALDMLLAELGPDKDHPVTAFQHGVLWVAEEIGGAGRAIYTDASVRPGDEGWRRVKRAFLALSKTPADQSGDVRRTIEALASIAVPASAGFEARKGQRRLKLHSRFTTEPPFGALTKVAPMLAEPNILGAVHAMMGDTELSLHDLVFEAAFHADDGQLLDAKLDIAAPAVSSPQEAFLHTREAAKRLSVHWPTAAIARLSTGAKLSYVGIGRDLKGAARLNLYLKPWRH